MARSGRGPSNVRRLAGERHFVAHGSTSRRKRGCLSLDLPEGRNDQPPSECEQDKQQRPIKMRSDPQSGLVEDGRRQRRFGNRASEQDKQPGPDRTNASQGGDESQSSNSSGAEDHYGGSLAWAYRPHSGRALSRGKKGRATEPRQAGLGPFGSRSLPRSLVARPPAITNLIDRSPGAIRPPRAMRAVPEYRRGCD